MVIRVNYKKSVISIIIQNRFFVKQVVLVSSLIRIAFLSSILSLKSIYKKVSEKLRPIAWHSKRWWNLCLSEDEKKEVEPIFT